ncbi:MAG: thiolase family protein [Saprospiraceae bacterium]|nr:thiolase family protein [Saprospiraceae bacterium]
MEEAYIVSYGRSIFAKAKKGSFKNFRSDDLAVDIIRQLVAKTQGLQAEMVDDLLVGCANPEGEQGLQIGRQIALRALGQSVPGMTINRYCASGLETISIATAKIRAGMGHCYIAGGVENMSQIPMEGYKLALNYTVADSHPEYLIGMGLTAEAVAKKYKVSRLDQDQFSVRSHQLANKALTTGRFKDEIFPVEVHDVLLQNGKRKEISFSADTDEGIRPDTNLEVLSTLKPVFAQNGSVTAGNSSQTTDGAAFVVVMSDSLVKSLGIKPLARMMSCSLAGVDPLYMGIGPCTAIPKALQYAGLNLNQIELVELNEAFAAQALAVIREAQLDPDMVNVNGGAIALGHPLGCSGARLSMTLIRELKSQNKKFGIATACVGGGQGIAAVFEAF